MGSGCELYRWTHHYCAVCEKAAPTLCFVHTHPLWVALHKLCATLHPPVCVFRALLPLITSSVDSLLSLYFAIWVVCICYVWKQHRFFSALENKQNTMKKKKEENSGLYCCHWARVNPVLSAFLISFCRKTKNSTGRRWHLLWWLIAVYDHRDLKILAEV